MPTISALRPPHRRRPHSWQDRMERIMSSSVATLKNFAHGNAHLHLHQDRAGSWKGFKESDFCMASILSLALLPLGLSHTHPGSSTWALGLIYAVLARYAASERQQQRWRTALSLVESARCSLLSHKCYLINLFVHCSGQTCISNQTCIAIWFWLSSLFRTVELCAVERKRLILGYHSCAN